MLKLLRITRYIHVKKMNKIQEEVDRLKPDFNRLVSEGRISSKIQAIMHSSFKVIELILATFLERSTKKTARILANPLPRQKKLIQL